jgi:hypothetical protein
MLLRMHLRQLMPLLFYLRLCLLMQRLHCVANAQYVLHPLHTCAIALLLLVPLRYCVSVSSQGLFITQPCCKLLVSQAGIRLINLSPHKEQQPHTKVGERAAGGML